MAAEALEGVAKAADELLWTHAALTVESTATKANSCLGENMVIQAFLFGLFGVAEKRRNAKPARVVLLVATMRR